MIFTFTVLHPEGEMQTFSILSDSVDDSLWEIAPLLKFGRTLLFATFKIKNGELKKLPVERIESESTADYLERLQQQWSLVIAN